MRDKPTFWAQCFMGALVLGLGLGGCDSSVADSGCTSDRDCGTGFICLSGECRDLSGPCASDGDCLSGQVCAGGVCVAACVGDHECPGGAFCTDGHCEPGCQSDGDCPISTVCNTATGSCDPGCTLDAHCPTDQRCLDGQCRQPQCIMDGDCVAGQSCRDYTCVQTSCLDDEDCPSGQLCIDEQCSDPQCLLNSDCADYHLCTNGRCLPDGTCGLNSDCPEGQVCTNGQCVDDNSCTSDGDCLNGQVCHEGQCRAQDYCQSDMDCALGYSCVDSHCLFAGCTNDGDCPSGQVCQDGSCVDSGCVSDANCPAGQHCIEGECYVQECFEDIHCTGSLVCQEGVCSAPVACDLIAQDCPSAQKCTVDSNGLPVCVAAGTGDQCLAQVSDDCPAGQLCTGYTGFACHDLCLPSTGAGCPPAVSCSALDGVADLGTCQCDPMAQNCPTSERCLHDVSGTPDCVPAADGSQCFNTGVDDCPAGMMCATADGYNFDCYNYCIQSTGTGCLPYQTCYSVGEIPTYGLCVGECHPVRQDCSGGYKCTLDEYNSSLCYYNVGSGSSCRAGVEDDCSAGQMCATMGSGYDCYSFCIVYNGIGCGPSEGCAGLDNSDHWGVCLEVGCTTNAQCFPQVCSNGECAPCGDFGAPACDAGYTCDQVSGECQQ